MQIKYPVYVLNRDGEVTSFASQEDISGHLEAIDIEDGEYQAWDTDGRVLELVSNGVGTWTSGTFELVASDRIENTRFEEVRSRAVSYRQPGVALLDLFKRLLRK